MRPESVEIKVTLAGKHLVNAIDLMGLEDGRDWTVVFCEDVTGAAEATDLLNIGVILRARGKSGAKGDSTIKLRPCRWSQLHQDYFSNGNRGDAELKIEADWAGAKRALAASMTAEWKDSRLSAVRAGDLSVSQLFTDKQLKFLGECSQGRVNLAAVTALPPIAATRWATFHPAAAGLNLDVRAERWQVDGLDFLELSVVSTVDQAATCQDALMAFVTDLSLPVDNSQESKTKRVLDHLIGKSST